MKTLHYYTNNTAYDADQTRPILPNVSFVDYENQVYYESYSHEYLTFKSLEDSNVIYFKCDDDTYRGINTIQVSSNNGQNWTSYTASAAGTIIGTLDSGESILIKGNNDYYGSFQEGYSKNFFASTKNFEISGNILSLIFGDNYITQSLQSGDHTGPNSTAPFYGLFKDCTHLTSAKNLIMPRIINSKYFASHMFSDCTSLTTAPILPAQTLMQYCYEYMFYNCANLQSITCLATDISANYCIRNWVSGVAASGTFVKAEGMNNWTTGSNGIPSGWTIENN